MYEEEKAIEFLKNKTTNYSLSGEELHYYLILYYLIINLQKENQQLKEQLEASKKARKEAIEILKEFLCTEYYCSQGKELYDFCSKLMKQLDIDKGE